VVSTNGIDNVVFDLGGVLIDWNPRYLYRQLFDDEADMERFLAEVCSAEWNAGLDAGRPWAEAIAELAERHPKQRALITAYRERWPEMVGGALGDTVEILDELRTHGLTLYALSNWSSETFPLARQRFDFLGWFDGVVLSGEVGVCKPDPRIFRHLLERYLLAPGRTVFIDDMPHNVTAAAELGMLALHFRGAGELRSDLFRLGLLG
jgi:2-haloacid dehalogenase